MRWVGAEEGPSARLPPTVPTPRGRVLWAKLGVEAPLDKALCSGLLSTLKAKAKAVLWTPVLRAF
jgi:hypothetical protein